MAEISVIVPIFNVEKYLTACLESVCSQSFSDIEIILVNDGSTDSSETKAKAFVERDSRIKLISQENRGLSAARNAGIEAASGKYIYFCDSDDRLEADTLSKLYATAEADKSDIVICGYFIDVENSDLVKTTENKTPGRVINGLVEFSRCFAELKSKHIFDPCWNKLYYRNLLVKSGVRMTEGEIFEDTDFNLRILPYCNKITVIDDCLYHYIQRNSGSITKKYNAGKIDILKKRYFLMKDILKNIDGVDIGALKYADFYFIKMMFSSFFDLFFIDSKMSKRERRRIIKSVLETGEYKNAIKTAKGKTRLDSIVMVIADLKNVTVIYWFSRIMFSLKYKHQVLFQNIKSKTKGD